MFQLGDLVVTKNNSLLVGMITQNQWEQHVYIAGYNLRGSFLYPVTNYHAKEVIKLTDFLNITSKCKEICHTSYETNDLVIFKKFNKIYVGRIEGKMPFAYKTLSLCCKTVRYRKNVLTRLKDAIKVKDLIDAMALEQK